MRFCYLVIGKICWVLLVPVSFAKIFAADPPITAATFSHDEKSVVVGSQSGIRVLSWPSLQVESQLTTDLSHVNDLKFAPLDGRLLAVGGIPGEAGEIEIWESATSKRLSYAKIHDDLIYKVDWAPSGQHLCTASADGTCKTVEVANTKVQAVYSGHSQPVLSVLYLHADQICSMGVDNTLRIWDSEKASSQGVLDNHTRTVNDAAVRRNTQSKNALELVSVGDDRTVRLWQPLIGRLVKFTKVDSIPRSVVWSKNGRLIYAGCDSGYVQIISTETMQVQGRQHADVGRISEIRLASSGTRLFVGGELGCRSVELSLPDQDR